MVRRRQDAAERWGPRDRDEALGGLGDALGALGTFVGAGEVLLRRVTPRRLRVALKHVEPARRLVVREVRSRSLYGNPSIQGGTTMRQRVIHLINPN